ncbi:MAG: right-handed parallel beta-helix repeat-containing protein [Nanoarchaeota archaeon]
MVDAAIGGGCTSASDVDDCSDVIVLGVERSFFRVCGAYNCPEYTTLELQIFQDSIPDTFELAFDFYGADSQWSDSVINLSGETYWGADTIIYDCCYSMDNGVITDCNTDDDFFCNPLTSSCDCGPYSDPNKCSNANVTTNQTICLNDYTAGTGGDYITFNLTFNNSFDLDCLNFTVTQCYGSHPSFVGCFREDGTQLFQGQNYTLRGYPEACVPLGGLRTDLISPSDEATYYRNDSFFTLRCNGVDIDNAIKNVSLYTNHSGTWKLNSTREDIGGEIGYQWTGNATFKIKIPEDDTHVLWNCLAYNNISESAWGYNNWTFRANHDDSPDVDVLIPTAFDYYVQSGDFSIMCEITDDFNIVNASIWANFSGTEEINQTLDVDGEESYDLGVRTNVTFNFTNILPKADGYHYLLCSAQDNNTQEGNSSYNHHAVRLYLGNFPPTVTHAENNASNYSYRGITFNFTVSSVFGLHNVTLYTNMSGTWKANQTAYFTQEETSVSVLFNVTGIPNGTFIFNALAVQNDTNESWASDNYTFYVNPCIPSTEGDWNITDTSCTIEDRTLTTANVADLNIVNGSLFLDNSTIMMRVTDSNLVEIYIEIGLLFLNSSQINPIENASVNDFLNATRITTGSSLIMINSVINETKYFYSNGSLSIDHSNITGMKYMRVDSSNNNITYSNLLFHNFTSEGLYFGVDFPSNYNNISYNTLGNYEGFENESTFYGIQMNGNASIIHGNNITKMNSSLGGMDFRGIAVVGSHNVISENRLINISSTLGNDGIGILVQSAATDIGNNTIKGNYLYGISILSSPQSAVIDVQSDFCVIRDNFVNNSNNVQFAITSSKNLTVINNSFYEGGDYGFAPSYVENLTFVNNTVEGGGGGAALNVNSLKSSFFGHNSFTSLAIYGCVFWGDTGNNTFIFNNCTGGTYGMNFQTPGENTIIDQIGGAVYAGSAGNGHGIGHETLINTSFSSITFHPSGNQTFEVQWYLDVYINDSAGNAVESASVEVYNNTNDSIYVLTTNASGRTYRRNVTEYVINSTATVYRTNYTLNVTHNGYVNTTKSVNITDSKVLYVTLTDLIPNIIYSPPTHPNNTFTAQDWVYMNVSAYDATESNITFYLYNSSGLVANMTRGAGNRSWNFTSLDADKQYWYNVTIRDRVSNENSTSTRTITLDASTPEIGFGINTEENNTYFNRDFIYLNLSINDTNPTNVTFYLFNTSGIVNTTALGFGNTSINFTSLDSNEQYEYNATVWDGAGNSATTETRILTLDTTAPVILLENPKNNSYSNTENQTFIFNLTETNPDSCSLYTNFSEDWEINATNNSITSALQHAFAVKNILDNTIIWQVWCNDSAQNSATSGNFSIIIDTQPPTIAYDTLTQADDSTVNQNHIDVNVTVSDIYEANITFTLANAAKVIFNTTTFSAGSYAINFTNRSEGVYYYNVTAEDYANNKNSTSTRKITLSMGSPIVTELLPADETGIGTTIVIFNFTAEDTNPELCSLYGNFSGSWEINQTMPWITDVNHNFTAITLGEGKYYWNVYCNDTLGNGNFYIMNHTVYVDLSPPELLSMNATSSSDYFFLLNESNESMWLYFNSLISEALTRLQR